MLYCKPQNFEIPVPLRFATRLFYFTDHPAEVVETPNYFLTAKHLLNPGDEIGVTCIGSDGTWQKAQFEVTVVAGNEVIVTRIGDWREGGLSLGDGASVKTDEAGSTRRYVAESSKPVHVGFGKWKVVGTRTGATYAEGLDKETAMAIAAGKQPIP